MVLQYTRQVPRSLRKSIIALRESTATIQEEKKQISRGTILLINRGACQAYTQKNFATEESLFVPCTEDIYKFVSPRIHICTCRHATAEELENHYLYQRVTHWYGGVAIGHAVSPLPSGVGGGHHRGPLFKSPRKNF